MRWSPRSIVHFAQVARFPKEAMAPAVALALASSGGDDSARDVQWPGPSTDGRGLWLIDVARYPALEQLDLYNAQLNAVAAQRLYAANGPGFGWSRVYLHGSWRDLLDIAAAAVAQGPQLQQLPAASASVATTQAVTRAIRAVAGLGDYLRNNP